MGGFLTGRKFWGMLWEKPEGVSFTQDNFSRESLTEFWWKGMGAMIDIASNDNIGVVSIYFWLWGLNPRPVPDPMGWSAAKLTIPAEWTRQDLTGVVVDNHVMTDQHIIEIVNKIIVFLTVGNKNQAHIAR